MPKYGLERGFSWKMQLFSPAAGSSGLKRGDKDLKAIFLIVCG
jgi:hypothetical protein